jgi:hypothetical protein
MSDCTCLKGYYGKYGPTSECVKDNRKCDDEPYYYLCAIDYGTKKKCDSHNKWKCDGCYDYPENRDPDTC